jgi:hypothetical protein
MRFRSSTDIIQNYTSLYTVHKVLTCLWYLRGYVEKCYSSYFMLLYLTQLVNTTSTKITTGYVNHSRAICAVGSTIFLTCNSVVLLSRTAAKQKKMPAFGENADTEVTPYNVVVAAMALFTITWNLTGRIDPQYRQYYPHAHISLIVIVEIPWFFYNQITGSLISIEMEYIALISLFSLVVMTFIGVLFKKFGNRCADLDVHKAFVVQALKKASHDAMHHAVYTATVDDKPDVNPVAMSTDPPTVTPPHSPVREAGPRSHVREAVPPYVRFYRRGHN